MKHSHMISANDDHFPSNHQPVWKSHDHHQNTWSLHQSSHSVKRNLSVILHIMPALDPTNTQYDDTHKNKAQMEKH